MESRLLSKKEKKIRLCITTDGTMKGTYISDAESGEQISNVSELSLHITPDITETTVTFFDFRHDEEKGMELEGTFTLLSKDVLEQEPPANFDPEIEER